MSNTELGFKVQQMTPTAIEQSNPVRVTVPDHGLTAGQSVRATRFYSLPVSDNTGMYQLNNNLYVVGNITTNTFDLFDQFGNQIDGTNFVAFVKNGIGQFTLTGPSLDTQNLNTQEDT